MKKIAITQRIVKNNSYFELREALDIRWGKLFATLDFLPVVLPYNYDFKNFEFDGVILSGGNDIGEFEFRDKFEFRLVEYCYKNNIPIFGVCRGMQIIAKYFKSTLKQVNGQTNIKHRLIVNDTSKYIKLLVKLKKVNSYHNMAIDKIGDNLIVSAWNSDKTVVKAIEHIDKKILGVMWHSEREEPFQKEELELIKEFFK